MNKERNGNTLTLFLTGRISSTNADAIGRDIAAVLAEEPHDALVFNAGDLAYISSAGLRVLLKVVKQEENDGHRRVRVVEASRDVFDIFEITGFTEFLDVEKAYRRIDVTGKEVIGRGFYGTVYRIDDDSIVKVYNTPDAVSMIQNEQRMAKLAFVSGIPTAISYDDYLYRKLSLLQIFVSGIPTAISYDIVRVGDNYGSVFELLRSKTFNDLVIESPGKTGDIVTQTSHMKKVD